MDEITDLQQNLPPRIGRLAELVYDLWWSSSEEARSLFRSISRPYWWMSDHNPIHLFHEISPERLLELSNDEEFLSKYDSVMRLYDEELSRQTRFVQTYHASM